MRFILMLLVLAAAGATQDVTEPVVTNCRAILSDGYHSKNPDLRAETAAVLGLVGKDPRVVDGLQGMLGDSDYRVRIAAIGGLADLSDVGKDPLLERMLADDVPEVAFSAAKVLWSHRNPAARALLEEIVSREEKAASGFFARKMRDTGRMFKTPKTAMMFGVRQGLGFVPVPGLGMGFSAMEALLLDPSFSPRANALLMLAVEPGESTERMLRDGLSDEDWSVRAAAVQSIAMQNRVELRVELQALLGDKKDKVRLRAAAAYLRLTLLESMRSGGSLLQP
jgi:HEAT repeat protein